MKTEIILYMCLFSGLLGGILGQLVSINNTLKEILYELKRYKHER